MQTGTTIRYVHHLWYGLRAKAVGQQFRYKLTIIIIIIIIIIIVVSCHTPFLPGTSLEPAVIPTAQASSFTLQYLPYYV